VIRSRVYLPKLESGPATVIEHLAARFPQVAEADWRDRMARGLVTTADGTPLDEKSPYAYGTMVFYVKEVPSEPAQVETETILYQDDEILVADKPNGMTVAPVGQYVARSLLHRLRDRTGLTDLTPLHRLDKETAGLVLFGINAASRAAYHALFSKNAIRRGYLAVAGVSSLSDKKSWRIENRLSRGEPWFRQRICEGPINAVTEIELLSVSAGRGLFRLRPETGKKHQLRVHMAHLGFPIIGDVLYPELRQPESSGVALQLLARSLSFIDPVTGEERHFQSVRELAPEETLQ
jgi:tRNA pseudouridine32 synthase/23S rRNA pseudouridine746 synthase